VLHCCLECQREQSKISQNFSFVDENFTVINNNSVYNSKDCITFDDHTSVDHTFVHNIVVDNIVVDDTFVNNTFVSVSYQQVNILLSDDSIDLCNSFNDSQNSRPIRCNGCIEFIDDQFSPHNSSSCCSSNTEDSLNSTVKIERNLNVLSLNCCGIKLRLQYPEFCELIKKK